MSFSSTVRQGVQYTIIGVGVTVIGLVTGAMIVSPAMSHTQRLLALSAVAGVLVTATALYYGIRSITRAMTRRSSRPVRVPAPTITLLSAKGGRTPRAVHALAAAGAVPAEIAWKTGLPLDAVAMLLNLSGARQLQPPVT